MTQRAVVWETEEGIRSVVDILEWSEDRLDLNKRRLMRELRRNRYGTFDVLIEQVDGDDRGKRLYERTVNIA